MKTTISHSKTYGKDSDLLLYATTVTALTKGILTAKEKDFLKKQIEKEPEKKCFHFNRYTQHIFVCLVAEKIEDEEYRARETNRVSGSKIATICRTHAIKNLTIVNSDADETDVYDLLEGLLLATYSFEKYKSKPKNECFPEKILLHGVKLKKDKILELLTTAEAVFMARNWVNEPGSSLRATDFAAQIKQIFGKFPHIKTEIFSAKKIAALKMAGIQAVSKGGPNEPAFIVLEYLPTTIKSLNPIVLIGKGIFFDTGGINLKPATGLADMKYDMSGAAAVAATMYMVAQLKPDVHVVGLIPATENRPGNIAYLPGDVLTMMNGVTVEIKNTDAEGRLILADALCYAKKYKPLLAVTIATLTGSAHATFGSFAIAGMQHNAAMLFSVISGSGRDVYERIAELPMWKEYEELIESQVADIQNVGGPYAGAITAGKFLQKFADFPLIHLDIAGPAFIEKASGYLPKGATGVGVRLFYNFLKQMEKMIKS